MHFVARLAWTRPAGWAHSRNVDRGDRDAFRRSRGMVRRTTIPKRPWRRVPRARHARRCTATRQLGITAIHTPVCCPQSNGMTGSFVDTFKCDYVSQIDRSTAATVFVRLPNAVTHFNEVHPHLALKLNSSRMWRGELARQAQENEAN